MKSTIETLLEAVDLAVRGVSDDKDIQKSMNKYGFNPQRVQEGQRLSEDVRLLMREQEQHYTQTRRISHQIEQDSVSIREQFSQHVAIAKTAFFKEPLMIEELKIKKISSAKWTWPKQALAFYTLAAAHMEKLQQFGAIPASFEQNQAAVSTLLDLKTQRTQRKGKAENSTQERNQKIKELRDWYIEFRKLARMAFQDTPQMLETFGILVLSTPRKRKSAAPAPVMQPEA